jgi:hypothetical protein
LWTEIKATLKKKLRSVRPVRVRKLASHEIDAAFAWYMQHSPSAAAKDGLSPTAVARQLGHRDTNLLHTVYGRFIPEAADYLPRRPTGCAEPEVPRRRRGQAK